MNQIATYPPRPRNPAEIRREGRSRRMALKAWHKLEMPRPVCECLSTKQIEMHHPDYERWWLVGFLCCRCHAWEHTGNLLRPYRLYDLRSRESFT